jgi:hypothetical protein
MENLEPESGTSREELLERMALMESMIREGRRTTGRYGWIFVLWGVMYVTAMLWMAYLPGGGWAWPVCIAVALLVQVAERARRSPSVPEKARARNIECVWRALGISISLYALAGNASHHAGTPAYFGAIFFFLGMAHGTSGMILRWPAQLAAAALWWACGIAALFATGGEEVLWLFVGASCFGMILFGIYAMVKESRRGTPAVARHA